MQPPDQHLALQALMQWQVCFEVPRYDNTTNKQVDATQVLFPSMRPTCDVFAMPRCANHATHDQQDTDRYKAARVLPVAKHQFNRLQAVLYDMLHPMYHMYCNGMMLMYRLACALPETTTTTTNNQSTPASCITTNNNDDQHMQSTICMVVYDASQSTLHMIARGPDCDAMIDMIVSHKMQQLQCLHNASIKYFEHQQAMHMKNQVCISASNQLLCNAIVINMVVTD
jgi:hypothetical protein